MKRMKAIQTYQSIKSIHLFLSIQINPIQYIFTPTILSYPILFYIPLAPIFYSILLRGLADIYTIIMVSITYASPISASSGFSFFFSFLQTTLKSSMFFSVLLLYGFLLLFSTSSASTWTIVTALPNNPLATTDPMNIKVKYNIIL